MSHSRAGAQKVRKIRVYNANTPINERKFTNDREKIPKSHNLVLMATYIKHELSANAMHSGSDCMKRLKQSVS